MSPTLIYSLSNSHLNLWHIFFTVIIMTTVKQGRAEQKAAQAVDYETSAGDDNVKEFLSVIRRPVNACRVQEGGELKFHYYICVEMLMCSKRYPHRHQQYSCKSLIHLYTFIPRCSLFWGRFSLKQWTNHVRGNLRSCPKWWSLSTSLSLFKTNVLNLERK